MVGQAWRRALLIPALSPAPLDSLSLLPELEVLINFRLIVVSRGLRRFSPYGQTGLGLAGSRVASGQGLVSSAWRSCAQ